MPSDRNTAYPFLEQMRTEELEALLQQEFTAADGGEPDVDYIMAIMEVMKQRDANPPAAEVDVDAAWRDFKENPPGVRGLDRGDLWICDAGAGGKEFPT